MEPIFLSEIYCSVERCVVSNKWGVILVNLGTPEAPTAAGVRRFLAEFLSDPRVVEIPALIWKPILYGFILPFRAKRVAKLYREIWTERGSPLKSITEDQTVALQRRLSELYGVEAPQVVYAMTYGATKLKDRVAELEAKGVERILILPLYPQYSATTTAAVYDQYAQLISEQRNISDIIVHKSYCSRDDYIRALSASIRAYWKARKPAQKLLFSFHGIPKRCVELGDPYFEQCQMTARRVASELELDDEAWAVSFQSRLGRAEWLTPYTDQLLAQWAKSDIASVDIICPAFASDCLETIEEIDCENRELFLNAGGQEYGVVPCLNSNPEHIVLLGNIVEEYVGQTHRSSGNQYFSRP